MGACALTQWLSNCGGGRLSPDPPPTRHIGRQRNRGVEVNILLYLYTSPTWRTILARSLSSSAQSGHPPVNTCLSRGVVGQQPLITAEQLRSVSRGLATSEFARPVVGHILEQKRTEWRLRSEQAARRMRRKHNRKVGQRAVEVEGSRRSGRLPMRLRRRRRLECQT